MLRQSKSSWGGVCCTTEQDKAACRSWFSPMCDDMEPEKCEALTDNATDATKKLRAVMVDKRGRKFIATRTFGKQFSIKLAPVKIARTILSFSGDPDLEMTH